jgi:hypothetical protein
MITLVTLVKGFCNRYIMIKVIKALIKLRHFYQLNFVTRINNVFGSGGCFSEFRDWSESHS